MDNSWRRIILEHNNRKYQLEKGMTFARQIMIFPLKQDHNTNIT